MSWHRPSTTPSHCASGSRSSTRGARAIVAAWGGPGTLVVVTHGANILPLTGIVPGEGSVVVAKADPETPSRLRVLGQISNLTRRPSCPITSPAADC